MKKVLLVGSIPPPYHGSNIYFYNLLNSSLKQYFQIYHLDTSDHRDLDNLTKLDFTNVYLALKNIFQLFYLIKNKKPDLIYIPPAANLLPFIRDSLFILISNYFSSAKIVIHMHAGTYFREVFYEKSNNIIKKYIKFVLSKVDFAIVVGKGLKYMFNGLVDNVDFIWNGSDFCPHLNLIKKKFERIYNCNSEIKIGFLSNLLKSKGILDFVHAGKIIIDRYPNVKLYIAGSWWEQDIETKKLFENYVKENNLKNKIKYLGSIKGKEKEKFFLEIDIFVFPTWYPYESFGIVNIEAMAAGCPVISSKNIGAIPEVIVDGETGFLVEPRNPKKLADKISLFLEQPELIPQMGWAARKRYEQYFTFDKHVQKMVSLLKKVLYEN